MNLLQHLQPQPALTVQPAQGLGQTFNDATAMPDLQSNVYGAQQGNYMPPFAFSLRALQPQQQYNQQQSQIGVTVPNLHYLASQSLDPNKFYPNGNPVVPYQDMSGQQKGFSAGDAMRDSAHAILHNAAQVPHGILHALTRGGFL